MRFFSCPLKVAKVLVLYKEGDANAFENHHPKSLLPLLAKRFERALYLYNRMATYIHEFKLLNPNQFSFREKFKTNDALAYLTEQIRHCLDKKIPCVCVFIDLKKAFDTKDHEILLVKLYEYGFRGPLNGLLRS